MVSTLSRKSPKSIIKVAINLDGKVDFWCLAGVGQILHRVGFLDVIL
jgi:hypothetical protein